MAAATARIENPCFQPRFTVIIQLNISQSGSEFIFSGVSCCYRIGDR
jgi:hypothetical protein